MAYQPRACAWSACRAVCVTMLCSSVMKCVPLASTGHVGVSASCFAFKQLVTGRMLSVNSIWTSALIAQVPQGLPTKFRPFSLALAPCGIASLLLPQLGCCRRGSPSSTAQWLDCCRDKEALQAFAQDAYQCSLAYGPLDVRTSLAYYNLAKVFQGMNELDQMLACCDQVIQQAAALHLPPVASQDQSPRLSHMLTSMSNKIVPD